MFPFGFESHLAFYLIVYVLTLVAHVFLMTYVLAGSVWLAWATVFPGQDSLPRMKQPLAMILRDWMPFVLSGAITAGVAPLLFVQILYRQQFYTANLLLGWRWMMVIPVLVIAFYLLYVIKSRAVSRWSFPVRCSVAVAVAASFLFVAFCWTTNHLLSLDQTTWPEMYRSGRVVESIGPLCLRLLMWVGGAFPIMTILAGWQLWCMRHRATNRDPTVSAEDWLAMYDSENRRLARTSLAGLVVGVVCGTGYVTTLEKDISSRFMENLGWPWLLIAGLSGSLQIYCGVIQLRKGCIDHRWLTTMTVAALGTLVATASLREIIRLAQSDLTQVFLATKEAADMGGFVIFAVFTVVNVVLIAWCIHMVHQRKQDQ